MKKLSAMLMALAMAVSMLSVAAFAESDPGEIELDPEFTVEVQEPTPAETTKPEKNPTTGIAVAALPMVIAAAGVAFTKKH